MAKDKKKPKDIGWDIRKCDSCGYRLANLCRRFSNKADPNDSACPHHTPKERV